MKPNRLLLLYIAAVTMLLGCTDHAAEQLLASADSLMNTRPDSAYLMLDSLSRRYADAAKSLRMRTELLKAKAQNKAYVDFTTDSVMTEVADYYDRHGSANDRMLAHYLLGCTYRDMKESPMALQCYYDAVEAADTLDSECDYSTMMSVWGQIATILDRQSMPIEELEACEQYQRCALICKDTMNYITGLIRKVGTYQLLGDTAQILSVTDSAVYLYKKHGYDALAAQSYFSAIFVYLNQQDYEKAGELLDIYRYESGLFDEYGNIAKGREFYYCGKGMYYKGIGQLDSAEYYYRKLPDSKKMEKYVGLADMYEQKGDVDSTILYSNLYRKAIDGYLSDQHTQSMRQAQGMYDYTRQQKIATTKIIETNHTKMLLLIAITIFVLVILTISLIFIRNKNRRQNQLFKLNQQYISTCMQLKRYEYEMSNMANNEEHKEKEIEMLHQRINLFHEKFQTLEDRDKIQSIMSCPIIDRIKNNLKPNCPVEPILAKDWDKLYVIINGILPVFGNTVINNVNLTQPERQIAVLTKLGFRTNDIALVLKAFPQRITTIRATVNSKLFGDKSARTLGKNLKTIN